MHALLKMPRSKFDYSRNIQIHLKGVFYYFLQITTGYRNLRTKCVPLKFSFNTTS